MEVQLTCCIDVGRMTATPVHVFTENVSRTGMLVRWMPDTPLPELNSKLIIDIYLPENSEFGPRVMRCRTVVMRVNTANIQKPEVAVKISSIRFARTKSNDKGGPVTQTQTTRHDLANMPAATNRVI